MVAKLAVKNGNFARSVFTYGEIANINVDIKDIKSDNCQEAAKEFAKFFGNPKKEIIEKAGSFQALLDSIGSPDELRGAVKLYNYHHPRSTGAAYLCSHCSLQAIKIPFGGQNRR
jgi:ABC-type glycerol-3-phosphate transport system substrate-binding protein